MWRAWSRSSIRSSRHYRPIERRTRLSVIPRDARISGGTEEWLMKAGHCAKLYTPPRDVARVNTLKAFKNLETCSLPPLILMLIMAPKPLICFLASS